MILVSGYYGFGNFGDEAILAALCADLFAVGVKREEVFILSASPSETQLAHNVNAVDRYDYKQIKQLLRQTQLFISGGGSLLQDASSWRTIPYYLGMVELARRYHVPVMFYGQGIGPVKSRLYQNWIKRNIKYANPVILRDVQSAEMLQYWGVLANDLTVTADLVFGNKPQVQGAHFPGITLNIRPYPGWATDAHTWTEIVNTWTRQYKWQVYFVPLGPGDQEIGAELAQAVPKLQILQPQSWQEAAKFMASTQISVSMRLHGLIFAAQGGTLPIGLNYDPKVAALAQQLGIMLRSGTPTAQLTYDILRLHEFRKAYKKAIAARVDVLHQSAKKHRGLLGLHLR